MEVQGKDGKAVSVKIAEPTALTKSLNKGLAPFCTWDLWGQSALEET